MSKNLLLIGFKKAGDAGDETCRLQGTVPCTNPSSQHSKAYFQTLKNSQNLSFLFYSTISCIERKKGRLQLVFLFHGIVWRDSAVEESEA